MRSHADEEAPPGRTYTEDDIANGSVSESDEADVPPTVTPSHKAPSAKVPGSKALNRLINETDGIVPDRTSGTVGSGSAPHASGSGSVPGSSKHAGWAGPVIDELIAGFTMCSPEHSTHARVLPTENRGHRRRHEGHRARGLIRRGGRKRFE